MSGVKRLDSLIYLMSIELADEAEIVLDRVR